MHHYRVCRTHMYLAYHAAPQSAFRITCTAHLPASVREVPLFCVYSLRAKMRVLVLSVLAWGTSAADCEGSWSEWGECSHVCGSEGTWTRTFHVASAASDDGAECPETSESPQEAPCNRHQCGCTHLHCNYDGAIKVSHVGALEEWGTQHRCNMVQAGGSSARSCHCICGTPGRPRD